VIASSGSSRGPELARQQARRHVVAATLLEPRPQERLFTPEVNESHRGSVAGQNLTMGPLQRRAGQNHGAALGDPGADLGRQPLERGTAVGVVERTPFTLR
jgi:hypothetical protein